MPHLPRNGPQTHRKIVLFAATIFCLFLTPLTPISAKTSAQNLERLFQNPPDEAKPMVRWWWFGVAVEKPEILRELQQMKGDGIGGAELAFVYPQVVDDKAHRNLPFLSPEMLDCVRYAQTEARKLGLRIDVTMGSGWPYGGPATTLAEAAGRLRTLEIALPSTATTLPAPKLTEGESIISTVIVDGEPKAWNPATVKPASPFPTSTIPRTAVFFIASHTRQQVKRASVGAEGYVLDPFSHQAVATHLKNVGEPLLKAFGPTPPYAVFSDSLEAYGADWTPALPAEFQKRRGYDLLPHLPELVAGGTPAAERVRHDYGQTLTELVDENYLVQINDWAKAHGTRFRSQTYGTPAVSFSSQRLATLPEGEGPQWRAHSTLRWATSANHVFGNTITSGETFTWLHSPVFRATPLDMKAEADIDFIMGENQLIFHGWPYSPPASQLPPGDPGWSLYAAAVFNDHNPWHPVLPAVNAYIARLSAVLREGQPANQVAILIPTDDAWASFAPTRVSVSGVMTKLLTPQLIPAILSAGYNFDYTDSEAVGRVGIQHPILILPPTDRISAETLGKISAYAKSGGKVFALGRLPTVDPSGKSLRSTSELSSFMTLVPDTEHLSDALHQAVAPDLKLTATDSTIDRLGFIRRRLPNEDIYFVVNTGNQPIDTMATFASSSKQGVAIDPDSTIAVAASAAGEPLHLAPYESRLFIFSNGPWTVRPSAVSSSPGQPLPDLSTDWEVTFTGINQSAPRPALMDWTADLTTLHYSGEAVYSRDFTLASVPILPTMLKIEGGTPLPGAPNSPPEHAPLGPNGLPDPKVTLTGPGMHAFYGPPIREAALVVINGKSAGALWHPPYTLDVSKFLKPGSNRIEIHVYNTALNAWSAIPRHDYKPLIDRYGDRFQMQDLDKVQPLPSGILGTVHLISEVNGR